jgi:hypothetical protein
MHLILILAFPARPSIFHNIAFAEDESDDVEDGRGDEDPNWVVT